MTFALVTEGISEHQIIKHLIAKYFKDQDPDINQMQPRLTEDELKQDCGSTGGWVEVLKYCEDKNELESIFIDNDYLVIQIDTDMCETHPFNVSRQNKNDEQLHTDVITRLKEYISEDIINNYQDRIIFAICMDTIECWLLPVYYTDSHKCKTTNCLTHLNNVLRKKNIQTISTFGDKNNSNSRKAYQDILKNVKRKSDIENHCPHNHGFKYFIGQLATLQTAN